MNKLDRVHAFLQEHEVDWLLITDSVEGRYLTGLNSSNMALLVSRTESHLFTDFRYRELALRFCESNGWQFHEMKRGLADDLNSVVSNGTVAFQSQYMSVDRYEELREKCPDVTFVRNGKEISLLFAVKTEAELDSIESAAACADRALARWIPTLTAGITEREAADRLEEFCREEGSRGPSFETIVLFGARAALPHGRPSEVTLQPGDTVLVDFGCLVDGFCSDMTRTFFYGEPSPAIRERYEITLRAQKAGVAAVRAGIKACEVDVIVRTMITETGYGEQFGHGTGHGVGLRIHELPAVNAKDETILQPGMVITVEPGIYVEGESGVRIEDLVVVTETGCRVLSHSPKELIIIK